MDGHGGQGGKGGKGQEGGGEGEGEGGLLLLGGLPGASPEGTMKKPTVIPPHASSLRGQRLVWTTSRMSSLLLTPMRDTQCTRKKQRLAKEIRKTAWFPRHCASAVLPL
eukprot:CAMPEP_0117648440 /NCGR_PEP_ID=MMETSP0804-20121206/405_1 /TAXON_ID=1074897 /ORGANISM="Tetraselmis astigmatica, Strain CCMP880" /LENGTH=108 /DNA_ID=CAMNT_0005454041 /DNA_START=181 /DNA_END=504 /DNA_ORIENTATION=-